MRTGKAGTKGAAGAADVGVADAIVVGDGSAVGVSGADGVGVRGVGVRAAMLVGGAVGVSEGTVVLVAVALGGMGVGVCVGCWVAVGFVWDRASRMRFSSNCRHAAGSTAIDSSTSPTAIRAQLAIRSRLRPGRFHRLSFIVI